MSTKHFTEDQIKARFGVYYAIQDRGYKTPCWIWNNDAGRDYGRIVFAGKRQLAHRVSFQLFKGPIAEGKQVCHHCDVTKCVNPDHLFEGTQVDNMTDMKIKGRRKNKCFGTNQLASKLTDAAVLEMRRLRESGLIYREIAKLFRVKRPTAYSAIVGRTWAHVA